MPKSKTTNGRRKALASLKAEVNRTSLGAVMGVVDTPEELASCHVYEQHEIMKVMAAHMVPGTPGVMEVHRPDLGLIPQTP